MTHNTREMETILEVLPHLILGNAEALHKYPQGQLAKDTISEMQRVIRETHLQELQKAREEERKIIKLRIDYDRRKGIPAEETVNDIYDSIELKDQSELDQPNK